MPTTYEVVKADSLNSIAKKFGVEEVYELPAGSFDYKCLEHTLRVRKDQVALLRSVGVEGIDASYLDRVVIAKDSLKKEHIYLERTATDAERDSGWYVGAVDDAETGKTGEPLETIYVYQIFQIRRPLMQALALPPGYLVVLQGDVIQAIFNDEGSNVLAL